MEKSLVTQAVNINSYLENIGDNFTTLPVETKSEKTKLFKVVNSDSIKLIDMVGKTVNMVDVYMERYERLNEETGEIEPQTRIIIISEDGSHYSTSSKGVLQDITKIFQAFGMPSKDNECYPMNLDVYQTTIQKEIDGKKSMRNVLKVSPSED